MILEGLEFALPRGGEHGIEENYWERGRTEGGL